MGDFRDIQYLTLYFERYRIVLLGDDCLQHRI